jgi:hypothetical protein
MRGPLGAHQSLPEAASTRATCLLWVTVTSAACQPVELPSERLWVNARIEPIEIPTRDSSQVAVTIDVTNWAPWPVRVLIGGPPYETLRVPPLSSGQGFVIGFQDEGGRWVGPRLSSWGQPEFIIKGWHVLRSIDPLWLNTPKQPLPPGDYLLRSGFGKKEAPAVHFRVRN